MNAHPTSDRGAARWRVDLAAVETAVAAQAGRVTEGIADMDRYLGAQVSDDSHDEVVGPLLSGSGASGVVRQGGTPIAAWGQPEVPEMLFSATKSVVSLVAGVAFDQGLLTPDAYVSDSVDLAILNDDFGRTITWRHLLQQTSMWFGTLWASRPRWTRRAPAKVTRRPAGRPVPGGPTTMSA